ncbi:MAG: hypothetical protein ACJASZ_001393 [Yoonia sp.]|jgi:hypothetical protein
MTRTHHVHGTPGIWPCDPLTFTRCRCDPPVQSASQFQCQERPLLRYPLEETGVVVVGCRLHHAHRHFNACATQHRNTATCNTGVRITSRNHDTRDCGVDQCLRAWRGLSVMGAGF